MYCQNKLKKVLFIVIALLFSIIIINKKNPEIIYQDFLRGKITVIKNDNQKCMIKDLFSSHEVLYTFCDIDEDSYKELHIKADNKYYVIKYLGSSLRIIYEGTEYEWPINMNNLTGIIYYRRGGAPLHDTYQFIAFEASGRIKAEIPFEWYDENKNKIMDEEDVYLYDNKIENKDKWEEITEIYRFNYTIISKKEWSEIQI